jgi:arsenate reductase (glutaredoxin)
MIKVYGITNCSTVVKARKWLESKDQEYEFWDYKKQGIDQQHLDYWCDNLGWEKVLNRAGMMWRKADQIDKNKVVDQQSAIQFMIQVPTSIKRPIIELGDLVLISFEEQNYIDTLKKYLNK